MASSDSNFSRMHMLLVLVAADTRLRAYSPASYTYTVATRPHATAALYTSRLGHCESLWYARGYGSHEVRAML